jgi:hypothetical protein
MGQTEKIGIPEIYKYYKETLIYKGKRYRSKKMIFKDKHRFIIDRQTFSNILKDFNLELARLIIEEAEEFKMPANLGTVRIRKYKQQIRLKEDGTVDEQHHSPDWHACRKLWAREYPGKTITELKQIKGKPMVYHLNEHTEGYVFRLFWNKYSSAIINRQMYSIVLTFTNKRRIAALIKSNPNTNYYE